MRETMSSLFLFSNLEDSSSRHPEKIKLASSTYNIAGYYCNDLEITRQHVCGRLPYQSGGVRKSHGALSSDRHVPNFSVVCCDGYMSREEARKT